MIHVVIGKIWHPFLDSPYRLQSLGSADATPRAIYAASVRQLQDLILCYRTGYPDVLFTSAASAALAMLVGALLRDVPVPPATTSMTITPAVTNKTRKSTLMIAPAAAAAQQEQQRQLKQKQYEQALIIWRSYFLLCIRCWQDMYTCYPIFRDVVRAHLAQALQGKALSPAEARSYAAELDRRGAHHYLSSSASRASHHGQGVTPQQQKQRQEQDGMRGQDIGRSATTAAESSKVSELAKVDISPDTLKASHTTRELRSRRRVAAPKKSAEATKGRARGVQRQGETQPQCCQSEETADEPAGQHRTRHNSDVGGASGDAPTDAPNSGSDKGMETQASTVAAPPVVTAKASAPANTGTFVSDFDKSSVAEDGRRGGVWMHTMAAQLDDLTLFAEFTTNEDLETGEA